MDFRLGEASDAFRAEVREFLDQHFTEEVRERVLETGVYHDSDIHRGLGERGWLAGAWPREYGGQDRNPYEMIALHEEFGLAGAPTYGMSTTMMIASIIRHVGTEQQRHEILPQVLRGEVLLVLGYTEPDSGSDVAAAKTRAVRDGDDWIINGHKVFTTNAQISHYVLLLTRTNPDVPKHQGLTVFLVPLDLPGIEIHPIHTLSGERTNGVFYSDVRVPDSCRVGEVDGGWQVMTVALTYERPAIGRGENDRLLNQVVEWARTTERDGRPVIDDPVVRERLARAAIGNEVAKLLGYYAGWVDAQGRLPGVEGSMAKVQRTESFVAESDLLLDLLGPEGARQHGAPGAAAGGDIEHAFRHAQVTTIFGGTSEIQRGIIAERGLGLPRRR